MYWCKDFFCLARLIIIVMPICNNYISKEFLCTPSPLSLCNIAMFVSWFFVCVLLALGLCTCHFTWVYLFSLSSTHPIPFNPEGLSLEVTLPGHLPWPQQVDWMPLLSEPVVPSTSFCWALTTVTYIPLVYLSCPHWTGKGLKTSPRSYFGIYVCMYLCMFIYAYLCIYLYIRMHVYHASIIFIYNNVLYKLHIIYISYVYIHTFF